MSEKFTVNGMSFEIKKLRNVRVDTPGFSATLGELHALRGLSLGKTGEEDARSRGLTRSTVRNQLDSLRARNGEVSNNELLILATQRELLYESSIEGLEKFKNEGTFSFTSEDEEK